MRAALMTLSLLLLAGLAQADEKIYRWTGADGKVQYGDLPPQGAKNVQKFDQRVGTSAATTTTAPPVENEAQTQTRRADCANKSAQLKTYKTAARLVEKDSLGREREFTTAERQLLIERTQTDLDAQCAEFAPPES